MDVISEAGGGGTRSADRRGRIGLFAARGQAIDSIERLGGSLPKGQQRLVEAWAEIHRAELLHDWDLLQSGKPPVKIEPLR